MADREVEEFARERAPPRQVSRSSSARVSEAAVAVLELATARDVGGIIRRGGAVSDPLGVRFGVPRGAQAGKAWWRRRRLSESAVRWGPAH